MSAVKKGKTITRNATLEFTSDDVELAIIAAVKKAHPDLKNYVWDIKWPAEGFDCIVTGTQTSGDGETADA